MADAIRRSSSAPTPGCAGGADGPGSADGPGVADGSRSDDGIGSGDATPIASKIDS
jgi:hypothetical protein